MSSLSIFKTQSLENPLNQKKEQANKTTYCCLRATLFISGHQLFNLRIKHIIYWSKNQQNLNTLHSYFHFFRFLLFTLSILMPTHYKNEDFISYLPIGVHRHTIIQDAFCFIGKGLEKPFLQKKKQPHGCSLFSVIHFCIFKTTHSTDSHPCLIL